MSSADPEINTRIKIEANLMQVPPGGENQRKIWEQLEPLKYRQFQKHWYQVETLQMIDIKKCKFEAWADIGSKILKETVEYRGMRELISRKAQGIAW